MDRFAYTNPYSQPEQQPKTVDEVLYRIEACNNDAAAIPQQLWLALVDIAIPWTLPQVLRFTKWIVTSRHRNGSHEESSCWVIHWLIQEGRWNAAAVYAATTAKEDDNNALLLPQYLRSLVATTTTVSEDASGERKSTMLQAAALCATISLYTTVRRLQTICSISGEGRNDSHCCWLLQHLETNELYSIAQRGLMARPDEWTPVLVRSVPSSSNHNNNLSMSLCDFKASCTAAMAQLSSDCQLQELATNQDLLRRLHQEASRLKIFYTPFSLSCLHLLSLLGDTTPEWKQLLDELLPYIVRSAFVVANSPTKHRMLSGGAGTPPLRSWTASASTPSLRLLEEIWSLQPDTISQAVDEHGGVQDFVAHVVSSSIASTSTHNKDDDTAATQEEQHTSTSNTTDSMDHLLERLLFLHRCCRCVVRQGLASATLRSHPGDAASTDTTALDYIFHHHARTNKSVVAVAFCRELMAENDRHPPDDLSRAIASLRGDTVWLDWTVQLATTHNIVDDDYHRPLLLLCCDVCYLVLDAVPKQTQATAETLEAMVGLVVTADESAEGAVASTTNKDDLDGDTPTAANNNRSRMMDQSMVWAEEKKRVSRGMDPIVRLTAASVLGQLGAHCTGALRTRAMDVANSVAVEAQQKPPSPDLFQRRLRLWTILSRAPDNEQYLSNVLHANECEQSLLLQATAEKLCHVEREVEELQQKCAVLAKERDAACTDLSTAKFRFQRGTAEMQQHAARESNALVQLHVEKFSAAEQENLRLAARLQEVEQELELRRESEKDSNAALQESNEKLSLVIEKAESTQRCLDANEEELRRCNEELTTAKQQLQQDQTKGQDLEKELEQERDHIAELEASENELREGLENLFGDMVSLARMYEYQEGKMEASKEASEEVSRLRRKVQEMQRANKDLTEQHSGIKYDNELLQRKYEKVREKLDKEREDRRKEDDQRRKRAAGPVSYMNQLHNESTSRSSKSSVNSSRRRGSSKENQSMSSARSRSQKR